MENRRDLQASKSRSPRASVGDCSPNFISRRVGKSMWDRRMRVTIFPQDSTTVSSGVSTRRDERKRGGRVLLHLFSLLLSRGYFARTEETLTETVLLEKFTAKLFIIQSDLHNSDFNTFWLLFLKVSLKVSSYWLISNLDFRYFVSSKKLQIDRCNFNFATISFKVNIEISLIFQKM